MSVTASKSNAVCVLNRLFSLTTKETQKLGITRPLDVKKFVLFIQSQYFDDNWSENFYFQTRKHDT